jgi:hypothetical protein
LDNQDESLQQDTDEEKSEHQREKVSKKRKYTKNLDNPRWKNNGKNNKSDLGETLESVSVSESEESIAVQPTTSKAKNTTTRKKFDKKKPKTTTPIIKNPSYKYNTRKSRRIKEKNYNINDAVNEKSIEKNADEQHLKNNCKYNLRSHKKEPDKDQ